MIIANDSNFAESTLYKESIAKLTNFYRETGIIGPNDTISLKLQNRNRRKRRDDENDLDLVIVIDKPVSGTASDISDVESSIADILAEAGQIDENDTVEVDETEVYKQ